MVADLVLPSIDIRVANRLFSPFGSYEIIKSFSFEPRKLERESSLIAPVGHDARI